MKAMLALTIAAMLTLPAACMAEGAEPAAFNDWYGQLQARTGLMFNPDSQAFDGFVSVPVLGYKAITLEGGLAMDPTDDDRPTAAVIGLTYNLGSLKDFGVGVSWAKYVSFHVGPYAAYNFDCDEWSFGALASVIEFSFDQGNVEKQKAGK